MNFILVVFEMSLKFNELAMTFKQPDNTVGQLYIDILQTILNILLREKVSSKHVAAKCFWNAIIQSDVLYSVRIW